MKKTSYITRQALHKRIAELEKHVIHLTELLMRANDELEARRKWERVALEKMSLPSDDELIAAEADAGRTVSIKRTVTQQEQPENDA